MWRRSGVIVCTARSLGATGPATKMERLFRATLRFRDQQKSNHLVTLGITLC